MAQDPNFTATIYANNQKFTAWSSFQIKRAFGDGISTFTFVPTEGYYGKSYQGLRLQPGDPVTIALAGQTAFTGWVTLRSGAYDGSSHQLVIAGQSKTVDLLRSSVVVKPGNYDGSTFEQAARAVMAPHPLSLMIKNPPDIGSTPFKSLSVQYGETVAEFISRTAMARNHFLTDDVNGNLVAGQASTSAASAATLVEGQNILKATFKIEDPAACSWNKLNGVSQTPGDDNDWPPRPYSATATNASIRSNVTKLFIAEHPLTSQELSARVTHEAMRSAWPIVQVSITVVGWLRPDGKLWATAPDDSGMVSVYSPMIFPTQSGLFQLGIQGVTFAQDEGENGTTTTLDLVLPNALTSAPTAGLGGGGGGGGGGSLPTISTAATPDQPDYSVST